VPATRDVGSGCRELLGRCHNDRRGCAVRVDHTGSSSWIDGGFINHHHHGDHNVDPHHERHADNDHRARTVQVELDGGR